MESTTSPERGHTQEGAAAPTTGSLPNVYMVRVMSLIPLGEFGISDGLPRDAQEIPLSFLCPTTCACITNSSGYGNGQHEASDQPDQKRDSEPDEEEPQHLSHGHRPTSGVLPVCCSDHDDCRDQNRECEQAYQRVRMRERQP